MGLVWVINGLEWAEQWKRERLDCGARREDVFSEVFISLFGFLSWVFFTCRVFLGFFVFFDQGFCGVGFWNSFEKFLVGAASLWIMILPWTVPSSRLPG